MAAGGRGTVNPGRDSGLLPFPEDAAAGPTPRLGRWLARQRGRAQARDVFSDAASRGYVLIGLPLALSVAALYLFTRGSALDLDTLRWTAGLSCASIAAAVPILGYVARFAYRRAREPGRAGLRLARVAVAAGPLLLAGPLALFAWIASSGSIRLIGADPGARPWVAAMPRGEAVRVEGEVVSGMAERLRAVLDANPSIRTLVLNSPGGIGEEGLEMARLVRARGLDTVAFASCSSACSVVFVSGRHRSLAAWPGFAAEIGFHSAGVAGISVRMDGLRQAYLEGGLRPDFVDEALATPTSDILVPDPDQLRAVGALDAVAGRYDVPDWSWSPFAPTPGDAVERALSYPWILSVLQPLDPGLADGARAWLLAARAGARNPYLLRDRFSEGIGRAVAARLAEAPDPVLRRAALHLVSGMLAARATSSTDCRRIGGYADLLAARRYAPAPMGAAADPDRPYEGLVEAAFSGRPLGFPDGAFPAVNDRWAWAERAVRPVPAEGCAQLVAGNVAPTSGL